MCVGKQTAIEEGAAEVALGISGKQLLGDGIPIVVSQQVAVLNTQVGKQGLEDLSLVGDVVVVRVGLAAEAKPQQVHQHHPVALTQFRQELMPVPAG